MLSPSVRVLCSLGGGYVSHKNFRTLRLTTGLSATWLSKKLKEMIDSNLVAIEGKFYTLTKKGRKEFHRIGNYAYPLFLLEKASLFSERISKVPAVESAVLFGSLAQGKADVNSDVDLLIIIEDGQYTKKLETTLRGLAFDYDISGEIFVMEEASFIAHTKKGSPLSIVFGVLEGYEVLFDKHDKISRLLGDAKERVLERYEYVEEARVWLKRRES